MRHSFLALLALIPPLTLLGCTSYMQTLGKSEILVPLKAPIDSTATCLVAGYSSVKNTFRNGWADHCKALTRTLEDEGLFAEVVRKSGQERYLVETIIDSTVTREFTHTYASTFRRRTPYRGRYPDNRGLTVDKAQKRTYTQRGVGWVAVIIYLADARTGEVLFKVRIKEKAFPETFAHELGEAVRRIAKVDK